MKVEKTDLLGVLILTPKVFGDERGFFLESYNQKEFQEAGIRDQFVQDNHSKSSKGVVRGLHFQQKYPQGKLVRCIQGEVLDVIVDIRIGSPSFGQSLTVKISEKNKKQVWVPAGLAHGFSVLSETAEFCYKVTDFYHPEDEFGILWNDPQLEIDWQVENVFLSKKDESNPFFRDAKKNFPVFQP